MESFQEAVKLLKDKFVSWAETVVLMLPNFLIALIIIVIAHFVSKKVETLIKKLLKRFVDNRALVDFLGLMTHIAVFLLGTLIAIKVMKLDQVIFSVLAGVGIVGLAIGFAFQDIAANFIAGIALVFRKDYPFRVGDIIKTNEYMGTVEQISLRDSMIRTFQGQKIFLPNKLIFENAVINYSLEGKRRIDFEVGVSYGDDLEKVKKVTIEAVKNLQKLAKDEDIHFCYSGFGDSSINFKVLFWIDFENQLDFLHQQSDAVMLIKKAYNENNITIPFPIRTLDFGIKGGEKLNKMLLTGQSGGKRANKA